MFCTKCGNELDENTKACSCCGAIQGENKKENKWKISRKMYIGIGVVLIFALTIISRKKAINLSDYVTLNVEGYDGYGTAKWIFDDEKFKEEYGTKLKLKNKEEFLYADLYSACDIIPFVFMGEINKKDQLSNGDEIVFSWESISENSEDVFNYEFILKDIRYIVNDLNEIEFFDAFEGLKLEYIGCEPNGRVSIAEQSSDGLIGSLSYEIEPRNGLSNGDIVTVECKTFFGGDIQTDYYVEEYGMVPETVMKQFVVEGLDSYVTSLEEIPEEQINLINAEVEKRFSEDADRRWVDEVTVEKIDYLGAYFLNIRPEKSNSNVKNMLYLIYKINVHEDYSKNGTNNYFEFYYYAKIDNLSISIEKECKIELSDLILCNHWFERKIECADGKTINLQYMGKQSLEEVFLTCVQEQEEEYTYVSSIQVENSEVEN